MTQRERYVKTIQFEQVDAVPLYLGLARESTLKRWRGEGLPAGVDYQEAIAGEIGIDPQAMLRRDDLEASFLMIPEFEPEILEHKGGHYTLRDWSGAVVQISDKFDESYMRSPKDYVTRNWLEFPVKNRRDWEQMRRRYDAKAAERLPSNLAALHDGNAERTTPLMLKLHGAFWQLREWCGFEGLCVLMVEDPDLVQEMADFWGDFALEVMRRAIPYVRPDSILISEDMAYKAHCMISPKMTRQFILPAYQKWIPFLKENGCPVVEIDSDGFIDDLIPLWIESGVNCCSPVEVAAHCDIRKYRALYGTRMAYLQGIDKRLIAQGGNAMERHVTEIVTAMLDQGGYIPGCDHGVPNDVSWGHYIGFAKLLAKLCGWL